MPTSGAIELTIFSKTNGALSKRIFLTEDGQLKSDGSECRMADGTARRVTVPGVNELAEIIGVMRSNEALTLGRLRGDLADDVRVVTKSKLNGQQGTIARTGEYLKFAASAPAFMLLDHDAKGMPTEVAERLEQLGGFWPAITSTVPALSNAARVVRRSTSAGLYREDTGERFGGSQNCHVYIAISDGTDIERTLKVLRDRLWLAGFGYFVVGAAGQLLDRSIIDVAVFGPERLVFEARPSLSRRWRRMPNCGNRSPSTAMLSILPKQSRHSALRKSSGWPSSRPQRKRVSNPRRRMRAGPGQRSTRPSMD
jgi:hypothetical protein